MKPGNPGGQGYQARPETGLRVFPRHLQSNPTHHAGPRVLPDKGVPQHLGQLALSKRCMSLVLSQGPDALLWGGRGHWGPFLPFEPPTPLLLPQEPPRPAACASTFRARRLLLISAPSMRVCRSALEVSAPLSFPARSTKENLPCTLPLARRRIWKQAWEREELELANVCPEVLCQKRMKKGYEPLKVPGRCDSPEFKPPHFTALSSQYKGHRSGLRAVLCLLVPDFRFVLWAAALPPAPDLTSFPGSESTGFCAAALARRPSCTWGRSGLCGRAWGEEEGLSPTTCQSFRALRRAAPSLGVHKPPSPPLHHARRQSTSLTLQRSDDTITSSHNRPRAPISHHRGREEQGKA